LFTQSSVPPLTVWIAAVVVDVESLKAKTLRAILWNWEDVEEMYNMARVGLINWLSI
jgi:hypothetical protein